MDIKEFIIEEQSTLIEAMTLLDKIAKKVLFVTRENKLKATITDGDIRRWILKKGNLDAKVRDIANFNPKFIYEQDKVLAKRYMRENFIEALPVLNQRQEIVSIVFLNDGEIVQQRRNLEIPVVIMAGGMGTRLFPYTKILPKPLIPIGDIPIIEHIINRFCQFGSTQFYLIVNHKKNMIKAYFNEVNRQYDVHYIDEELPLGTGGGLSLLKGKITSTFVLSNCDILIEEDYEKIYEFHKQEKNLITMVCSLKNINIPYGVIEINEKGEIDRMVEKPQFPFFANTGMYIVEPKVISEIEINKSISFPDIIQKYKDLGEKIGVYPISEHAWLDMGQFDELEKMRKRLELDE